MLWWLHTNSVRNITSWSYCSRGKWRIHYLNDHSYRFEVLRYTFKTFHEAYTIFFKWIAVSKAILRSSWYFSSIVISINFYYVECGDGRQPGILVGNFWISRSKTRTFSTPGFLTKAVLLLFFALVRAFAFFLFKAKTTLLVLWIFTSNISPHFAEFAGMKLKIISAR